jgi:hypothetical protein
MVDKPSFDFIVRDIQSQKQLAREALENAKRLEAVIKALPDGSKERAELEEAKKGFLDLARKLADNANNTSLSANNIVASVSARST